MWGKRNQIIHSAWPGCRAFPFSIGQALGSGWLPYPYNPVNKPTVFLIAFLDMTPSKDIPDSISSGIAVAKRQHPELTDLFHDITTYISTLTGSTQTNGHGPPSKKRKLEDEASTADTYDSIADVSFSIPQRKKLKLEMGRNRETGAIRGTSAATGETEFGIRYSDVDCCVCLPVPEKAQPQYSFCVLPTSGDDQLLFSVPGTKIRPEAVHSDQLVDEEHSYKDFVITMLSKRMKKTKVIEPNAKDFSSTIAQAHRKGEKAVHVKAFRGSKDGTSSPLYFHPSSLTTTCPSINIHSANLKQSPRQDSSSSSQQASSSHSKNPSFSTPSIPSPPYPTLPSSNAPSTSTSTCTPLLLLPPPTTRPATPIPTKSNSP